MLKRWHYLCRFGDDGEVIERTTKPMNRQAFLEALAEWNRKGELVTRQQSNNKLWKYWEDTRMCR